MPIPSQIVRQSRAQQKARVYSLSAPVGGWNARDSLDRMAETDAVVLDNWFPDEGEVRVRKGYTEHANGLGGDVELLAEYHAGATRKFIAAANGSIWDATSATAATNLASGFSSNRWQWANFEGEMGLVNGSDAPQKFAGSAVSAMTISASAVATVSSFIGIHVHKSRTYFWQVDSQDFYYSAVNALGGSLTKFPLSRVSQFGGNLLTMTSWSRDAGDGMDDLAVFVMTSGDVIVYSGSDPGDASDWSLVGVFNLPRPISRRAVVKFGGDVVIATEQGYFPLSAAFSGRVSPNNAITDKISGAVRDAAQIYGSNFGWEAILYQKGHWLLFNVPITTNTTYQQHVMNTVTGAWCRFKNINARTWGVYNGDIYFGGDGKIYKADNSAKDGSDDIEANCEMAYNYLGSRQISKVLSAGQPVFSSDGDIEFELSAEPDFGTPTAPQPTLSSTSSGAEWDTSDWDAANWVAGLTITKRWRVLSGKGYNFGFRFFTRTSGLQVNWYSLNIIYKPAGMI